MTTENKSIDTFLSQYTEQVFNTTLQLCETSLLLTEKL